MTRSIKVCLVVLLVVGAAVRSVGLSRGYNDFVLPERTGTHEYYHFNPDEATLIRAALAPLEPLNPELTAYGSVPVYLLRGCLLLTSRTLGTSLNLEDPEDERTIYYVARTLAVLASCATLALTWLIGFRLFGPFPACLGLLFIAFSPGAIQQAHFYIVDGLFALLSLLALYLIVLALSRDERWPYVVCGVAIGATAAVRVSGALLGFALIGALLYSLRFESRGRSFRDCVMRIALTGTAGVSSLIALQPFLIVDPSLLLRFGEHTDFAMSLQFASGDILQPWTLVDVHSTPFWDHWFGLWPLVSGWPLTILFTLGFAHCAYHRQAPAALLWAALYFVSVGLMQAKAVRHVIPLLPMMSLFAAAAVTCWWNSLRGSWLSGAAAAIIAATAIYSVAYGIAFAGIYVQEDSRLRAGRWIEKNIPSGVALGVEGGGYSMADVIGHRGHRRVPLRIMRLFYVGPYMSCELQADYLQERLLAMDYIALIDVNRYAQFTSVPDLFPAPAGFYYSLAKGDLGFERVREFQVHPTVLGIQFTDDGSEPSFSGYDHPAVWIFRKKSDDDVRVALAEWVATLMQSSACPDGLLRSAASELQAGSPGLAVSLLENAHDQLPTNVLPQLLLAEAYRKAGEMDQARTALSRVDPEKTTGHLAHVIHAQSMFRIPAAAALSLVHLGQYDLAVRFLRSGRLEIFPYSERMKLEMASSYNEVAQALLNERQIELMLRALDESSGIHETATAHNIMALWKEEAGDPNAAIGHWSQALDIDSTQVVAHRHLAELYSERSDHESAKFHERQAARWSAGR